MQLDSTSGQGLTSLAEHQDFSTVASTKKIPLTKLEDFKSDLLHITEDDEIVGYKHVFQTRLTKETTGERIRSPMRMFTQAQTYMDNNIQTLLDHLHSYYNPSNKEPIA